MEISKKALCRLSNEKRKIAEYKQYGACYYFNVVKGRSKLYIAKYPKYNSKEESTEESDNSHPPFFGKEETEDNQPNTTKHNQQT